MAGAKFPSLLLLEDELRSERHPISDRGGGEDKSNADRETAALILILSFELGGICFHSLINCRHILHQNSHYPQLQMDYLHIDLTPRPFFFLLVVICKYIL